MKVFGIAPAVAAVLMVVSTCLVHDSFGFQQPLRRDVAMTTTTTSLSMGLFDGFIKSMESGYAGGEDSQYAKIKQQDEAKRLAKKQEAEQRKARGFTELKDYDPKTQKTFAKMKYDQDGNKVKEDIVSKWTKQAQEKKEQGGGFKFPWDKFN